MLHCRPDPATRRLSEMSNDYSEGGSSDVRDRGLSALADYRRETAALRDRLLAIALGLLAVSTAAVQIDGPIDVWKLFAAWGVLGAGVVSGLGSFLAIMGLHWWRWINTGRVALAGAYR